MTALVSFSGGRGIPFGGISPAESRFRIISHISRFSATESNPASVCIFNPPELTFALWQSAQFLSKKGCTESAKKAGACAAADSWPGWGDEGIVITQLHIANGLELAQRSLELVEHLKLGHRQVGTSQWLVGALHLAAGRSDEAIAAPTRARDAYGAGGERASELLALGYLALARSRQDALERHRAELEEICLQLQ